MIEHVKIYFGEDKFGAIAGEFATYPPKDKFEGPTQVRAFGFYPTQHLRIDVFYLDGSVEEYYGFRFTRKIYPNEATTV